jgi:phosphogluconate dehydratase
MVPEAANGGMLAYIQDGDLIRLNAVTGELSFVGDIAELEGREAAPQPDLGNQGCGRELFLNNRQSIGNAEQGASFLFPGE